jgi:DNA modification methylase
MTPKLFLDGKVKLYAGDCRAVLLHLEENSIDSAVTDPPYHLTSIVKRFGAENAAPAKSGKTGAYARASRGFMGKQWDGGDIAFDPEIWRLVLRVLRPGAHLLAFGGTRTYHRMACAIEDAGFEIRDQVGWAFASGFPKSHNISRNLDDARCSCEGQTGADQVLQRDLRSVRLSNVSASKNPQSECGEVLLPRLPEQGASTAGRQQLPNHVRPEESSMEGWGHVPETARKLRQRQIRPLSARAADDGTQGWVCDGTSASDGPMDWADSNPDGVRASYRPQSTEQSSDEFGALAGQPEPQIGRAWALCDRCGKPIVPDGLGTALKPAWEPICLARKPLSEGSIAANVLRHGTGALNIDGCRVAADDAEEGRKRHGGGVRFAEGASGFKQDAITTSPAGRWPANICHDGSEDVLERFPETGLSSGGDGSKFSRSNFGMDGPACITDGGKGFGDSGSAARFFYSAKANSVDRIGSHHPTVKPLDLLQYLVRLITPKGGTVLDCFSGTGTTAEAAYREGMSAVLIEREPEYLSDIEKRMSLVLSGPDQRRAASVKQLPHDDLPIFSRGAA